jgi:hypothetical protein
MKKLIFLLILFAIISYIAFAQDNDLSKFMVEADVGYTIGINLESAMQIDVKLIYPYKRFGLVLEAGSMILSEKKAIHFFIAPLSFL